MTDESQEIVPILEENLPEKIPEGRPPHVPTDDTRKTVRAMTAYGIPQDGISAVIGISEPTLRKYYGQEIATATAEANAKVAQTLFRQATEGQNTAAAIFWLKARAGWTEKVTNEFTGPGGSPLTMPIININFPAAATDGPIIENDEISGDPG